NKRRRRRRLGQRPPQQELPCVHCLQCPRRQALPRPGRPLRRNERRRNHPRPPGQRRLQPHHQEVALSGNYLGGSSGGSGSPPADLSEAWHSYLALKESKSFLNKCREIKEHITQLSERAKLLSKDALLLSEKTPLHGSCDFIKPDD